MTQALAMTDRLNRERRHFNQVYRAEAAQGIAPLSDFDKRRYANPPAHTIYPREYYFHLLAPLAGKDILEIACGNGIDATISAYNGAQVHAYDLSPESVAMTRRRLEVNGLADRAQLQVTGAFDDAFPGQTFDAIMGYAALHHLPLEGLAQRIYARLRPGGVAVFAEPVVNSKTLYALRKCIPIHVADDSDDETPLNDAAIAEFARPFDRMVRREFQCLSRIWPLMPPRLQWPVAVTLHRADAWLMRLPSLRRFATVVVFALYRDR